MDVALGGNVAMLIFLGKQYLGQSDKMNDPVAEPQLDQSKDQLINDLVTMLKDK